MLVAIKLSDKDISAHVALCTVTVLRDTLNPLLQLRFSSKRTVGYWRILYRNKWVKVGQWPEIKTADIRRNFSTLIGKVRNRQEVRATRDCFMCVGDVLAWYEQRTQDNANLSEQRKKDIASGIKCHLLPSLERVEIDEINHAVLDKCFVWPAQKRLAKSSVTKHFHTLKAAFNAAFKLNLLPNNPLGGIKISDFGDFSADHKEPRLFPSMVQALLDELLTQRNMVRMICTIMLTLGTRIGETRQAKWRNFSFSELPTWIIPKQDTKTNKTHTIHLPVELVQLLLAYKTFQQQCKYVGQYLFPNFSEKDCLSHNDALTMIHSFSGGEWSSHDLRKCARTCWQEQGVDSMVAEIMLNHDVGKVAGAYVGKAKALRLDALNSHCAWLLQQNSQCFMFNLDSTQVNNENKQATSNHAA